MEWVWVVGGGVIQEPLIREFTNRGYHVCVGDKDPLCHAVTLTADNDVEVFEVDTHDPQAHLEAVEAYVKVTGSTPKGVMTAGTDVGPTVSLIANTFHLPGVPYDVAFEAKCKPIMRELVDLPHPWWSTSKPLAYPCVEKPWMSSGSKGVKVLWTPHDYHFRHGFLWEEYLTPHVEASTDWMVVDGYPIYVNGAHRWFDHDRETLEVGWVNPFVLESGIQELACRASRSLGVTEGPFKMDLLRDDRYGWSLLECATRWSGSFDHTLGASLSTNRNLSIPLVDYALGQPFNTEWAFSHSNIVQYAGAYTPPMTGEWLITDDMLQACREHPGVVDVIPMRWRGGTVTTLAERPLFIVGVGKSIDEVRQVTTGAWAHWLEVERTLNLGGGAE